MPNRGTESYEEQDKKNIKQGNQKEHQATPQNEPARPDDAEHTDEDENTEELTTADDADLDDDVDDVDDGALDGEIDAGNERKAGADDADIESGQRKDRDERVIEKRQDDIDEE